MFKLPLIKVALGGQMMMGPAPAMPAPPMPPVMPMPGIAGNGGAAMTAPGAAPKMPAPGAPKAFKVGALKLAFSPGMYPPIQQHPSRAGIGNAVVDTGKDFMEGLGNYSLDVLKENEQMTQRPNDPRVMARTGNAIV